MKEFLIYASLLCLLAACGRKDVAVQQTTVDAPKVLEGGAQIIFPGVVSQSFFETEDVSQSVLGGEIVIPARVAATVVASDESATQNIILFDNPDLATNYTQLLQHLINIRQIRQVNLQQRRTELERTKDLQQHGAATGKDLLEAQTALSLEEANLANEQAANIEHETKLKAGGFQPEALRKAQPGTAYVICEVPEGDIRKISEGSTCTLQFTAFDDETFTGKIEDIADLVDPSTRMVKLRVSLQNPNGRLKAGMFGTASFGLNEGSKLSVSKNAMITVQARNYVFVKTDTTTFERREVSAGRQINDRIVIYHGLVPGEKVAVKGAMQLKGLSFGY